MKPRIIVHTQAQTQESLVIGDKPPILGVVAFIDEIESVMESGEQYSAEKRNGTVGCCICFKTGALLRILEPFKEVLALIDAAEAEANPFKLGPIDQHLTAQEVGLQAGSGVAAGEALKD